MLALYRAGSFHPIEKVLPSPSPSGRGVGVRASEPSATVPAKPNQFAVKRRYSGNETPEYVEIDIEMNHAVFKPRKLIDPNQEWYWTKEWQKSEKEVDKELEKEECSPLFQTAEEALKWLEK